MPYLPPTDLHKDIFSMEITIEEIRIKSQQLTGEKITDNLILHYLEKAYNDFFYWFSMFDKTYCIAQISYDVFPNQNEYSLPIDFITDYFVIDEHKRKISHYLPATHYSYPRQGYTILNEAKKIYIYYPHRLSSFTLFYHYLPPFPVFSKVYYYDTPFPKILNFQEILICETLVQILLTLPDFDANKIAFYKALAEEKKQKLQEILSWYQPFDEW
jgi:hypothetical protein